MKRIAMVFLLATLCSCGRTALKQDEPTPVLGSIPAPSALTHVTPSHTASGSHAVLNRTLVAPGESYAVLPGYNANADLGPDGDAILHGSTTALSYAMYEVSSNKLTDLATISEIGIDVRWDGGDPTAPQSVFLGLPDHVNDRWVWFDTRELTGQQMYDVSTWGLQGLDPAGGLNSYIAVVNYSGQDAHIDELRLRFALPTTVDGDEYVYYTSRDAAASASIFTSVSRVGNSGGAPEILFEADEAAPSAYLGPTVVDYQGNWRLVYTKDLFTSPAESWLCDMEGNGSVLAGTDGSDDIYTGGFNYGDNHGLIIHFNTGSLSELWAVDSNIASFEYGRLSQPGDVIQTAVWDLSVDTSINEYAAIASVEIDTFDSRYGLMSYVGNGPFDINAPPSLVFPGTTEDSRDPFMVELSNFFGDSEYWIYFASRNFDDATYNIYRMNRITAAPPEPVVVDPAYELRYPTITPNGKYLAYMRAPAGSTFADNSEIVVADLLDPTNGHVVADDGVAFEYWYDPSP
jgi:hypothetical protein